MNTTISSSWFCVLPFMAKKALRLLCVMPFYLFAFLLFASCDDYLTIYPEDDIVDDEYWRNGDQVQSVVMSCYRYMCDNNVLRKMVQWGEIRSDNVDYSTGSSEEEEMHNANILSSSSLVRWDGFYKVINICNNVLAKAPAVRGRDVNFTEDKFHHYMAEAYTIRSLCYFYLIRSFGDVPYVTEPSDSEQKDYMVPQAKADSILACLIADMEEYALPWSAEDWDTPEHTHGRVTTNAVRALLADMYLWKASDISNADAQADYRKCSDYCDAILNDDNSTLVFTDWQDMYGDVFYQGNSTESIFELNFRSNGLANTSTAQLYGNTSKGATAHFNPTTNLYNQFGDYDERRFKYLQLNYVTGAVTPTVVSYKVFKYEGMRPADDFGSSDYSYRSSSSYANWIVYRLADVYLIKAEAMAEMAKAANDETMAEQAVHLCNVIYTRANQNLDSLTIAQASDAENVVLQERRRELCFEGKRWYDLMRKVRREGSTQQAVDLLAGARSGETTLFKARLSTPEAWYLPISKTEMNANPNLRQNAYYSLTEQ